MGTVIQEVARMRGKFGVALCFAIALLLGIAAFGSAQDLTATEFRSNGDLNSGWYWLRDQPIQHYEGWTLVGIAKDMEDLAVFGCTDRVVSQCFFLPYRARDYTPRGNFV